MARLEDLKAGAYVRGLSPDGAVKIVQAEWFGDRAIYATFEEISGSVHRRNAGRAISFPDCQIAATARSHGAAMATRNVADFEGCGVEVIDPWTNAGGA